MTRPIVFGEIKGVSEGMHFEGRKEMMHNSFHRNWGAGIDGNGNEGAAAIVLSGGYEDDIDLGDEIIYTGAGGKESGSSKQKENQTWDNRGNAGLLKSMNEGMPVRVIRGFSHKSQYSPKSGYTYAGLYSIIDAWEEVGKSGFIICRFRLIYSGTNPTRKTPIETELSLDHNPRAKKRVPGTVLRIVRDTKLALDVKKLYSHKCQVCGIAIPTKNGFYSEGAHIRPLGKPHDGEDSLGNIICLCPNHHVMFDKGMFSISDKYQILGVINGSLTVHPKHIIDKQHLKYHRNIHGHK